MRKLPLLTLLCIASLGVIGWPSLDDLGDVGKGVINSTGVVTDSQVDSVLKAGGKLQQASKSLTDEQEYYLGRGVSALILKQYPLYTANPKLTLYVNLVGNALAARSNRPELFGGYHFAILDTKEINALSAPGGFIYISKGFLDIIPNEDALAAVFAHEIGHVSLGHGVKAISESHLTEAASILGKEAVSSYGPSELSAVTDAFGDSVNQTFDTLVKTGYSRSQEYEADEYAAKLLARTGYSVKGLPTMLNELAKAKVASHGGWMDTHPAPEKRIAEISLPKQNIDESKFAIRTARYKQAVS